MIDLARVLIEQGLLPEDHYDALALSDLALEYFGFRSIPSEHQGLHVQLAYHLGECGRATTLLQIYPDLPDVTRSILELDLTNPFVNVNGTETADWLRRLEDLLPGARLALSPTSDLAPFDRLTATPNHRVAEGPRVSVIVTSFQPSNGLHTAVQSLINQSWTNVEILVVDDGSGPEYDPLLRECDDLDTRVKVIKLDTNVGTYCARNVALDAAAGEFVTFLDSDDWAHPLRLEQQLEPLLVDRSRCATIANAYTATSELRLTQLHRLNPRRPYVPSLLFRRDPVLNRLGYFDGTRKGADNEYLGRIRATFGSRSVGRLRGTMVGLYRQTAGSLTRADFRGPWLHPARFAYKSAYGLWHRQIAAGTAEPYLRRTPARRSFAAPGYLVNRGGDSADAEPCDVVFAGDWRRYDSLQRALIEEIKALRRRRGLRIGILHMEALTFMTADLEPLATPIQELVNDGTITHCLSTEARRVSLLVIRDPLCLQFAAAIPSRLAVDRAVIVANHAPSDTDGRALRYLPCACAAAVEQLFSIQPLWLPQDPQVRASLRASGVSESELFDRDARPVIDPEAWCRERSGFRSSLPVVGFHSDAGRTEWPKDCMTLLQVYPDAPTIDVRVIGGRNAACDRLGASAPPPNWVAYEHGEVSIRSFLFQVDFWAYFPAPTRSEVYSQAILEALASGCVVILPRRFRQTFGDAAVYRCPGEVQETITRYYSEPALFMEQSRLAQQRVRTNFGQPDYCDLVSALFAAQSDSGAPGRNLSGRIGTRGGAPTAGDARANQI